MNSFLCQLSQAVRVVLGALVAIVISLGGLSAHELTPAVADLTFEEGSYSLEVELNLEALMADIGPDHDDTDDSPNKAEYEALRALSPADVSGRFQQMSDQLLSGFDVSVDGVRSAASLTSFTVSDEPDLELARTSKLTLNGVLPEGASGLVFKWAENYGPIVLRTATDGDEEGYAALLAGGEASEVIKVEGQEARGLWAVFVDYIGIGFEHILPLGLDHILFVVGLFLLSTQLRPLLWQVTAFTLAHTVTLALGMAGIINIPGSIVEPIIAASIVYVAVENIIFKEMSPWRPFVVFAFGLLHGLGFAGVLTEFGIPSGQFVPALIGFNIGVELGQLTVIAACFLAVGLWFGKKPWYRSVVVIPGSVLVALIGAYWFLERTVL